MANDNKYGRLYPDRAVAPLREMAMSLIEDGRLSADTHDNIRSALSDLDRLGFPRYEPLFLLRGQDALAGEFVHCYAQAVRDYPTPLGLDADHIDAHADRMDHWTPRKLPD